MSKSIQFEQYINGQWEFIGKSIKLLKGFPIRIYIPIKISKNQLDIFSLVQKNSENKPLLKKDKILDPRLEEKSTNKGILDIYLKQIDEEELINEYID